MTKSLPLQLLLATLLTVALLALLPLLQDTAGSDALPIRRPTTTRLVTVLPLPPDALQPPADDLPATDAPPPPAEPPLPPSPEAPVPPSPVTPDSPPPPTATPVRLDISIPSVTLTPPLPDLPHLDVLPPTPSPQPEPPIPAPATTADTSSTDIPAKADAATDTTHQPVTQDTADNTAPTSSVTTGSTPEPSPSPAAATRTEVAERHLVRPVFPRNVPRVSGTIELSFTVRPDGTVAEVAVERCDPQLDASYRREAIRAARRSLYHPRTVQGRPVAARVRRRIDFVVQP